RFGVGRTASQSAANDRTGGKATDHAGRNRAAITRRGGRGDERGRERAGNQKRGKQTFEKLLHVPSPSRAALLRPGNASPIRSSPMTHGRPLRHESSR